MASPSSSSSSFSSNASGRFAKLVKLNDMSQGEAVLLEKSYKVFHKLEAATTYVTEEECLTIDDRDADCVYIFPDFRGDAFLHLANLNSTIFGSSSVLTCFHNKKRLPFKYERPILSLAMRHAHVVASNLGKPRRGVIANRVKWMGGEFSASLTANCTHLVTNEVGSDKYYAAAASKMAIVTAEWVDSAWKLSVEGNELSAIEKSFSDQFKVPLFKGLSITCSNFAPPEKKFIETIIQNNGGIYTRTMRKDQNSHLILKDMQGEKYKMATEWQIPIVNIQWLKDSADAGSCLNPNQYNVVKTSTPNSKRKATVDVPDVSVIEGVGGNMNATVMSDVSAISPRNVTSVNETIMPGNDRRPPKSTTGNGERCSIGLSGVGVENEQVLMMPPPIRSARITRNAKPSDHPTLSDVTGTSSVSSSTMLTNELNTTPLSDLDVTIMTSGFFLKGCTIYLHGFEPHSGSYNKLRKIIGAGSGIKVDQLNAKVTHIVVPENLSSADLKSLEMGKRKIKRKQSSKTVSAKWLTGSFKLGKRLPETDFDVNTDGESNDINKTTEPNAAGPSDRNDCFNDNDELMSQYLAGDAPGDSTFMNMCNDQSQNNETTTKTTTSHQDETVSVSNRQLVITPPLQFDLNAPTCDLDELPIKEKMHDLAADEGNYIDNKSQPDDDDVPHIFEGHTFTVFGFSENETNELNEIVETAGGIIAAGSKTEYAVCGIYIDDYNCLPQNVEFDTLVTNAWLQYCVEEEKIVDVDGCILFRPIVRPSVEVRPLVGCVVTLTGFTGVLRDTLSHVSETMGANVTETLNRISKDDMLATTHLVAIEPTGKKYQSARKWKINVVTANWLYAAIETNDRPDESKFPVVADVIAVDPIPSVSVSSDPPITVVKKSVMVADQLDPDEPMVTPINNRLNALRRRSSRNSTSSNASSMFDPDKSFHPKFDFADASFMQSPASPSSANRSIPIGELMDKNIRIAAKYASEVVPSTEILPLYSQPVVVSVDTPEISRRINKMTIDTPLRNGPLAGVVIAVSRKLSDLQSDLNAEVRDLGGSYRWALDKTCTHFIFYGRKTDATKELKQAKSQKLFIVGPDWIHKCVDQQKRLPESQFPYYESSVMKSTRKAKPKPPNATSPVVVSLLFDSSPMDETSPGCSTTAATTTYSTRSTIKRSSDTNSNSPSPPKRIRSNKNTPAVKSVRVTTSTVGTVVEDVVGGIEQDKEENVFSDSSNENQPTAAVLPDSMDVRIGMAQLLHRELSDNDMITRSNPRNRSRGQSQQMIQSKNTSGVKISNSSPTKLGDVPEPNGVSVSSTVLPIDSDPVVTWDDADQRRSRAEVGGLLKMSDEPTQFTEYATIDQHDAESEHEDDRDVVEVDNLDDNDAELEHEDDEDNSDVVEVDNLDDSDATASFVQEARMEPQNMKFIITSFKSRQDREKYRDIIVGLGAPVVAEEEFFDEMVTHCIMAKPVRNEKVLCAMASGKWILTKEFLDASNEAGQFVKESEYEYGAPEMAELLTKFNELDRNIAFACRKWRSEIVQCPGKYAFDGWKVILYVDKKKKVALTRLLTSGGAIVFEDNNCNENPSHVFIDVSKGSCSPSKIKKFKSSGVQCLKSDYIAAYLVEPNCDQTSYLVG